MYEKDESMVGRGIAGEYVLVPIRQNVAELDCIYSVNEVGTLIWKLLDEMDTVDDIISSLVEEYNIDRIQAERDLKDFLTQLETIGAIKRKEV
ncbi:PqqD family protein [Chloroflexota bacterium]